MLSGFDATRCSITQRRMQHRFDENSLQWRHNGNDIASNHQPHHCLLNRLFGCRPKNASKFSVTGLCAGNSPGTGEFPAQMASNAGNVSIWWRHHVKHASTVVTKYPISSSRSISGISAVTALQTKCPCYNGMLCVSLWTTYKYGMNKSLNLTKHCGLYLFIRALYNFQLQILMNALLRKSVSGSIQCRCI